MKIDYVKKLGRGLTVASIIVLSSLIAIAYHSEAIAGKAGGGRQNAGAGKAHGAAHSLLKAVNASDMARAHAAHESAVVHADPAHLLAFPGHYVDGVHIR